MNRRQFIQALSGAAVALGRGDARAAGQARRIIFFYFPDGIPGRSARGEPSLWDVSGGDASFTLPDLLAPLAPHRDGCIFTSGLSMGATDAGNHPGGAKKLLTAADGGRGESIDRALARTVGAGAPFRHLYLGAMANQNNASGDKHISYPSPGLTTPPEDNPLRAFQRLFGGATPAGSASTTTGPGGGAPSASVIDTVLADLRELQARLGSVEQARIAQHLEMVRQVELRIKGGATSAPATLAACASPGSQQPAELDSAQLYDAQRFPQILRAQIDLMVLAMSCGLTNVGVIQASHHTSELLMSRFAGTELYDKAFDMRSHQASHYGAAHDPTKREFRAYVAQRRWFVQQLAYLLEALKQRREGADTMFDHSLVVLVSEVSDGNSHSHDDMPFIVAGLGGGSVRSGRVLAQSRRPHAELLAGLARAMGAPLATFGQPAAGPLPGLLA